MRYTASVLKDNAKKVRKVAVGLSGGVDSAVTAHLLKEEGFEVTGVYMNCWENGGNGCNPNPDRTSAIQVASHLDIKFKELDFIKDYRQKVIDYFYSEYKAGRTPNPDVMCNREIKFGLFFDWVMNNSYDYVATGHYARIKATAVENGKQRYELLKGVDDNKDQSYFLYVLEPRHLKKTMFPLGEHDKKYVREFAEKISLPNAKRPDSTGICFIGEVDIAEFLKQQIKPERGQIENLDGKIIGEHDGVWYYTIGQRHGFNVKKYQGVPLYVIKKDVGKNVLIVGKKEDAYSHEFKVQSVHWINEGPCFPLDCNVRIRHLGEMHKCTVTVGKKKDGSKDEKDSALSVKLEKKIFAVAPGQSAVFYKGDIVLGGGIIQ